MGPRRDTSIRSARDTTQIGLAVEIYGRMVESEVQGGVRLRALEEGSLLQVRTINRIYEIEVRDGETSISGHPRICPCPVPVRFRGSSWGGSMLKPDYLGLGMHMEVQHPVHSTVTTSKIVSVCVA